MSTEAHKSLFTGAAAYYLQYRPNYPQELFDLVVRAFGLDGTGRLLDLGCGPGNVCLGLYRHFAEVVAVDINPEMLAEGRQQAERMGANNVTWLLRPAEEVGPDLGRFRLVTMGRSFHWMQRDVVLQKAYGLLEPGGGLALLGSDGSREPRQLWQDAVQEVVKRWRKREREVTWDKSERFEDGVARSDFRGLQHGWVSASQTLGVDDILGELYSMSGTKPELFENHREAFEADLRQMLLTLNPEGIFERTRMFSYLFAWKGALP